MSGGYIALEDGTVLSGRSVAAPGVAFGEAVFTTAMTGYQETVTDPSFAGQLVTFTAPMVGNYGVDDARLESPQPWVKGVLMRRCGGAPWAQWLALARHRRSRGRRHAECSCSGSERRAPCAPPSSAMRTSSTRRRRSS